MRLRHVIPLVLLAALNISLAQTYTFAGLEFGANPDKVKDALLERGYEVATEIVEDDITLRMYGGEMLDYPINVTPVFDAYNRLESVVVMFYVDGSNLEERDTTLIRLYDNLMGALASRYGMPFMGTDLAYQDGKVDDSGTREDRFLARQMWVKANSMFSGSPEGLQLMIAGAEQMNMPPEVAPNSGIGPDDVVIMLGYTGDPTSGNFGTGTGLDDL